MDLKISDSPKAYTSTSIEIKTKDGCSKTIREEECENGFIITVDMYTPNNSEGSNWVTKRYISEVSVINKKQKEEEANLGSILKELGYA